MKIMLKTAVICRWDPFKLHFQFSFVDATRFKAQASRPKVRTNVLYLSFWALEAALKESANKGSEFHRLERIVSMFKCILVSKRSST